MARPNKYNDEELIELLQQVRSQITTDINPYILEKQTGISKAVWKNRFNQEIEQLNEAFNNPVDGNLDGIHFPLENVAAIYERHRDSENILISKFNSHDIFVQNLLRTTSQVNELNNKVNDMEENEKQLLERILNLEQELRTQKEATKHYEEQYLISVGQSTFGKQYRTIETKETLSLKNKKNVKKVDFISRNSELFD